MKKSKLINHLDDTICAKHYRLFTERSYVNWNSKVICFHSKNIPCSWSKRYIKMEFLIISQSKLENGYDIRTVQ